MDDEEKTGAEELVDSEQSKKEKKQDSALTQAAKSEVKKQTKEQLKKQAEKQAEKEIIKTAGKGATKVAAGGFKGVLAVLASPEVLFVIAIILIILIGIGLVSFLTSMPAVMKSKMMEKTKAIWNFMTMSEEVAADKVTEETVLDLASYLYEKGYDVEGFGFLPVGSLARDSEGNFTFDTDGDGKANTDYKETLLFTYACAVERTYLTRTDSFLKTEIKSVLSAIPITSFLQLFSKVGDGMVVIQKGLFEGDLKVEIDRDNGKIIVTNQDLLSSDDVWTFDAEGFVGPYGKPLEFLLALHLSTMAPDFVNDFCTDKYLQTEVHVSLEKMDLKLSYEYRIKLKDGGTEECDLKRVEEIYKEMKKIKKNEEKNDSNTDNGDNIQTDENEGTAEDVEQPTSENEYEKYDVTLEELEKVIAKMNDEESKTAQPYITEVANHWYSDLSFEKCYENGEEYDDKNFEIDIELEDENAVPTGQLIATAELNGGTVKKQVNSPVEIENAKGRAKMIELLTQGMYYIYDGSKITAAQIEEAKKLEEDGKITKYKVNKDGTNNGDKVNEDLEKMGLTVRRKKIDFNLKNTMTAFTMLEAVGTEDSETIYRMFKNLIYSLGYATIDEIEEADNPLDWPVPDYTPVEWPHLEDYGEIIEFGRKIYSKATIDAGKSEENSENTENGDSTVEGENSGNNAENNTENSAETENTTSESNGSKLTSLDNFLLIGDSRYDKRDELLSLGNNINNQGVGSSKVSEWLTVAKNGGKGTVQGRSVNIIGDYAGISVQLGANSVNSGTGSGADAAKKMKEFLAELKALYPNTPIFVNSCLQVNNNASKVNKNTGKKNYQWDPSVMRDAIKDFNQQVMEYCNSYDGIYFVDISSGLEDSNGFVKLEYESDGLHMTNAEGMNIFVQNIKNGILNSNASIASTQALEETGFEPGMKVITPGKALILKRDKDEHGEYIEIKFNDSSLSVENMVMYISGVEFNEEIKAGDELEVGKEIGVTTESDILLILKNDKNSIIGNIEDYMKVPIAEATGSQVAYSGKFSSKGLMFLIACEHGGLINVKDEYYTTAYDAIGSLNDSIYLTVGPGLLMTPEKYAKYIEMGGEPTTNLYSQRESARYRKDLVWQLYLEELESVFVPIVEGYLDGYQVTQNQLEALVVSAYQRGPYDATLKSIIHGIKAGKTADELKGIWTAASGQYADAKRKRRTAEWLLFKTGTYTEPYTESHPEYEFTSETPFEDFMNSIN